MKLATWAVVLAIAGGCAVGVSLRHVVLRVVGPGSVAASGAFVVTTVGAFVLGALIGSCAGAIDGDDRGRLAALIALIATLATFAASGVIGDPETRLSERTLLKALAHISVGILTAVIGFAIAVWIP